MTILIIKDVISMEEYNKGSHAVYDIKYHVIGVIKYRYKVLNKQIASRLRELIRQGCEVRQITIIRGSIGKEHVHMYICLEDVLQTLLPVKLFNI